MPVVSFVSSKGGSGKTTASVVLATTFAAHGANVTLIDADPNQPIKRWAKDTDLPDRLHVQTDIGQDSIIDGIVEARQRTQIVIVDVEGSGNMAASNAVSLSNLVLIPTQGSELDMAEASKSIRMIRGQEKIRERPIPFALFLTRTSPAVRDGTLRHIESQIFEADAPCLEIELHERAAFRAIFSIGATLESLASSQVSGLTQARDNAALFTKEVGSVLNGEHSPRRRREPVEDAA